MEKIDTVSHYSTSKNTISSFMQSDDMILQFLLLSLLPICAYYKLLPEAFRESNKTSRYSPPTSPPPPDQQLYCYSSLASHHVLQIPNIQWEKNVPRQYEVYTVVAKVPAAGGRHVVVTRYWQEADL